MTKNEATIVNFSQYMPILRAETVGIHHLLSFFKKTDMDYDKNGNIFINFKKETDGTPILVAHLDNVLSGEREPVLDVTGKRMFGRKNGIGFDDKAGIIAIVELWRRIKDRNFRIIFTADEEVGGIGAHAIDPTVYDDAAYIIELDRRGNCDLIQTSGCTRLCSDEFASMFTKYGFKKATGTFTDVNVFKLSAPHVNMVNLSIGYYEAHTNKEYLEINDFQHIVDCVQDFIETHRDCIPDNTPAEPKRQYNFDDRYGRFDNPRYGNHMLDDYDWLDDPLEVCDWCTSTIDPKNRVENQYGVFCCKECCEAAEACFYSNGEDDEI